MNERVVTTNVKGVLERAEIKKKNHPYADVFEAWKLWLLICDKDISFGINKVFLILSPKFPGSL